jgi:hypothetical protein
MYSSSNITRMIKTKREFRRAYRRYARDKECTQISIENLKKGITKKTKRILQDNIKTDLI